MTIDNVAQRVLQSRHEQRTPQDLTAREAGKENEMKVKMTADSKRLVNLEDAKMFTVIFACDWISKEHENGFPASHCCQRFSTRQLAEAFAARIADTAWDIEIKER